MDEEGGKVTHDPKSLAIAEKFASLGSLDDSRYELPIRHPHVDDEQLLNNRVIAGLTYSRKLDESILPVNVPLLEQEGIRRRQRR